MRDVRIKTVLNGWIVEVGCQTIVFNDEKVLVQELVSYLRDPKAQESHYLQFAINARHVYGDVPPPMETTGSTGDTACRQRERTPIIPYAPLLVGALGGTDSPVPKSERDPLSGRY